MAFTIEEHHVLKYAEDVQTAYQQEGSRLRSCVEVKTGIVGKSFSTNDLGLVEAATKNSRAEAHQHQNPDHSVRWANLIYYYNSMLLDRDDDHRVLADPRNKYVMSAAMSLGRRTDRSILEAAIGTAITGEARTGTQALPSAQKIAAGSGPMSIVKLTQAKRILDEAEVPDDGRYIAISAQALEDLLGTTQVTSSDYNTVKALVQGQLNTYLGFEFKRTQLTALSGTTRSCVAWHRDAIVLGFSDQRYDRIAQRRDLHDSWETYSAMDLGAVRKRDKGVVQIDITES